MQGKVRQITDSIHGTIYVSELEYEMMSTPFFYRLHDVYQSSTVYMTFPSNRTKRYEHSLGTMELAGQMFYSAVTNASIKNQRWILDGLESIFKNIYYSLRNRNVLARANYYSNTKDKLGKVLPTNRPEGNNDIADFLALLLRSMPNAPLLDRALCKQEVCFFNVVDSKNENRESKIYLYSFLYQCALEALRIAALFHDIGHPPFSHIMESLICELDQEMRMLPEDVRNCEKIRYFFDCTSSYITRNHEETLLLDLISDCKANPDPAFHESVGRHILYDAFSSVLSGRMERWELRYREDAIQLKALYLITIIEFTFGILIEKSNLFASLHRIIDGTVDADRLDYCVRDVRNAGMDWGAPPYSRIISAVKFARYNDQLVLAFPEKVCDDIDDLIVNRYRIFQRINYHHRVVKTAELMRRSVYTLSKNYLLCSGDEVILPEISCLWGSLGATFGRDEAENQISKWTDAWLISALSGALTRLSQLPPSSDNPYSLTEDERETLNRMLEEILLNRKQYYPLLKRHRDALLLGQKVREEVEFSTENYDKIRHEELKKAAMEMENGEKWATSSGISSAVESVQRLDSLDGDILGRADFALIDTVFPLPGGISCYGLIEKVLRQEKEAHRIADYFLWQNTGYKKYGINFTINEVNDASQFIYLYSSEKQETVQMYDPLITLYQKLDAERAGALWMFSYVRFSEQENLSQEKIAEMTNTLLNKIAKALGANLRQSLNELCNYESILKLDS